MWILKIENNAGAPLFQKGGGSASLALQLNKLLPIAKKPSTKTSYVSICVANDNAVLLYAVPGLGWGAAAFAVYVAYDKLTGSKEEQHH